MSILIQILEYLEMPMINFIFIDFIIFIITVRLSRLQIGLFVFGILIVIEQLFNIFSLFVVLFLFLLIGLVIIYFGMDNLRWIYEKDIINFIYINDFIIYISTK